MKISSETLGLLEAEQNGIAKGPRLGGIDFSKKKKISSTLGGLVWIFWYRSKSSDCNKSPSHLVVVKLAVFGRTKPPGQAFGQFAGRGQQLVVGAPCSCLTGGLDVFSRRRTWNTDAWWNVNKLKHGIPLKDLDCLKWYLDISGGFQKVSRF